MNQHPEQIARDKIDQLLKTSGWTIQSKSSINLAAALGVAFNTIHSKAIKHKSM